MDWRLGHAEECGLRERRMFRGRAVYYAAVAADFVLRFGWMASVVPHW